MAYVASLEDAENQLRVCISNGAALIYWSYRVNSFDFFLSSDRIWFCGERCVISRRVIVTAELPPFRQESLFILMGLRCIQSRLCTASLCNALHISFYAGVEIWVISRKHRTSLLMSRNAMKPLAGSQEDVPFEEVIFVITRDRDIWHNTMRQEWISTWCLLSISDFTIVELTT